MKLKFLLIVALLGKFSNAQDFVNLKPTSDYLHVSTTGFMGIRPSNLFNRQFVLCTVSNDIQLTKVNLSIELNPPSEYPHLVPSVLNCQIGIYNADGSLLFSTKGKDFIAGIDAESYKIYTITLENSYSLKAGNYYFTIIPLLRNDGCTMDVYQVIDPYNVAKDHQLSYIEVRTQDKTLPNQIPIKNISTKVLYENNVYYTRSNYFFPKIRLEQ